MPVDICSDRPVAAPLPAGNTSGHPCGTTLDAETRCVSRPQHHRVTRPKHAVVSVRAMPGPARERVRERLRLGARTQLVGLDRRSLGFTDVVAQSVAVMAPCAAAATIPMLLGQANAPLVWCVVTATVLCALVASTLGVFASRVVAPGALYTYAAKGLGPGAGAATAAAMTLGYGSLAMFTLSQTAAYGLRIFGLGAPSTLTTCLAVAGIAVVMGVVLIRGVRVSARVGLIIEAVAVAGLLALVGVLVTRNWDHMSVRAAVAVPTGWSHYLAGVAVATCGIIGFESAATLSVEAKRPLRTIPRAINVSLALGAVVVLIATLAQAGGANVLDGISALGEGNVDVLTASIGASWVAPLVNLGVCASFLACALASTTALTRTLLSLAREGVLPSRLGYTHPRFKTPVVGVVVSLLVMVAVIVVSLAAGASESSMRGSMAAAPAIGFMVAYVLVCVAAPAFLRKTGELQRRAAVTAWLAAVGFGGILVVFVATNIGGIWAPGIIGALVWLALAAVGYGALRRVRPLVTAHMGIHETPMRSEVFSGHLESDTAVSGGPSR